MLVVLDANVLCSALIAKGRIAEMLFSDKLEIIAPELLFVEFERHRQEILSKSKLSESEFSVLLALFKKRVKIVPIDEFEDRFFEASSLLNVKEHFKDTAYVALALKFNCPLWSDEKLLKKINVRVLNTSEVNAFVYCG